MNRSRQTIWRVVPTLLVLMAVAVAWEIWVRVADIPEAVFPPPSSVVDALIANAGSLADHARTTLAETAIGLVIGALLGVLVAAGIAEWRFFRNAVEPLMVALQTVPPVVLAPMLVLAFGFGLAPRVVVVIGVVFFPVAIAATGAFRSVSPDHIDLARSFGASRSQMYRTVILPSATPAIFDGLRISAAYALGSAAVAEQIGGARSGLGLLIARAQRNSQADVVLAGVLVIAVLSVLIYLAVGWLARRLTPYAEAT